MFIEPIETSVAQTSEDASRVLAYDGYLRQAVESIDCRFGDGYAAANPQLVAAYITAGMQYYVATTWPNIFEPGWTTSQSVYRLPLTNLNTPGSKVDKEHLTND